MKRLVLESCVVLCTSVFCMILVGTCGCVSSPDLPQFGYSDPRAHARRNIEAEQGIKREADGWICSSIGRYRVVDVKGQPVIEWSVYVSNPTDMPRRASCAVVSSYDNPAPLANDCLAVRGGGSVILAPNTAGEINGMDLAPNHRLRSFSAQLFQPVPSPKADGPIVLRCLGVKDGIATIEWKATVASASHALTATFEDGRGRKYVQKELMAPEAYDVTATLYNEAGQEIHKDSCRVKVGSDRTVPAGNKIKLPIALAAEISKITVQWEAIHAKPQARATVKRFRVSAYCSGPCRVCETTGITANGGNASLPGVAADPVFAFGRVLEVPGYGVAVVDDRGMAIRGDRLDVRMRTHREAKAWGVRQLDCIILE